MLSAIKRFYNPVLFQGSLSRRRYFEGGYFKHVSADCSSELAIIPGVSLSGPSSHAFARFMKCSHGIGSLDHRVDGEVRASGGSVGFAGESGYIEKDWGFSMPRAGVVRLIGGCR